MDHGSGEILEGRYRLAETVGRGGMGQVRRARDLLLERDVAVKLLRADLAADPTFRSRLRDEARAAGRICHPNAVAVYDIGETNGSPYIVMEHVPGPSLAEVMSSGPLAPRRVRQIGRDVAAALAAAHELGILHRDVKPANIVLAADGTAKITDFGIAEQADRTEHTRSGEIMGTASYLAPERLCGRPATPASDVYSLGVVLHEALSGLKPFLGDTPAGSADGVSSGPARSLRELRPDAPDDLVAAVDRALELEPGARWQSAVDMAAALGDRGAEEPTTAIDPVGVGVRRGGAPTSDTAPLAARFVPGAGDTARLRPRGGSPLRSRMAPSLAVAFVVLALVVSLTGARGGDSSGATVPGEPALPSQTVAPDGPGGDPLAVASEPGPVAEQDGGGGDGGDEGQETHPGRGKAKGKAKDKD